MISLLIVLGLSGCASLRMPAPTAACSRVQALDMAKLAAAVVGGEVIAVEATGSMRPVLDGNALLVIEAAPWADLRRGDLVVYRSARGHLVVHRLVSMCFGAWSVAGDANGWMDAEEVSPKNFKGRVCAVFYSK